MPRRAKDNATRLSRRLFVQRFGPSAGWRAGALKLMMITLAPLLVVSACKEDLTQCKAQSEEWMKAQCEKDPQGSACPDHERYNESLMILVYNCDRTQ